EKRSASFVEIDDELSECIADPNAQAVGDDCELGDLLNTFLSKQKKSRRIMFVQRYFYGLSVSEISKVSGLKESNIKVSLHRMREDLREYLRTEGIKI
ncbi:MAG: sigma-70 family RNA polymerase sigma factor, partial [Lachnospiraceae bacterium]|nr:sigma-70 family RNA polymerase sigma factor [Lachnospiraceae bacterium]